MGRGLASVLSRATDAAHLVTLAKLRVNSRLTMSGKVQWCCLALPTLIWYLDTQQISRSPMPSSPSKLKASVFVTCLVDQFYPEVGEGMVTILERLGVELDFPKDQTCCGQPAFNSGYHREAKDLAKRFLRIFQGDSYIVVPSGSCGAMVKVFYQELLHDEPELLKLSEQVGARMHELSQFLVRVLGVTDVGASCQGKVTYHDCCHLRRELEVVSEPRDLIRGVRGAELVEMRQSDVCCGFGGTFAVKYADISGAILRQKAKNIEDSGADVLVANDVSCLMHMAGSFRSLGVNVRPMHLAQFLNQGLEV